jgi:WD40 repeat protein
MTPPNGDDQRRPADAPPKRAVASDSARAAESYKPPETLTYQVLPGAELLHGPLPAIAGYEVLGLLGRGGMGVVYRARHLALKRIVALKMVLVHGHATAHDLARFRVEGEAVARLQHPNIVQIHDVGEAGGLPYCALEYLDGGSLTQKLGGKALAPSEAAPLVDALARAMQFAHSRNIVHRDLKPGNVLLTADGTPKVTDFGLARQLDEDSGRTQAGAVMGTPSYMAPEQAAGETYAAGPAADVYALGAILYECLTGRPPFRAATITQTLEQVRNRDPEPLRRLQPTVPRDLETICLKCLHKEPERRYASAEALAEDLRRWRAGEPIEARPVGGVERALLWARRKPALAGLVATAAVLGAAVVAFVVVIAIREHGYNLELLHAQGETNTALKQARQESARTALDRGLHLCEAGETGHGLLYLTRALDRAVQAEDGALESAVRYNIAAWQRQQWSLRAMVDDPSGGQVGAAALSPDGATVAVALPNQTVQLWDAGSGREGQLLHALPHGEAVRELSFSADGRLLLTRTDRTVRIVEVATGQLTFAPLVHRTNVMAAALSPDGTLLLTGTMDGIAQLWRTDTGQPAGAELPHKHLVAAVAFSPRGDLALTAAASAVCRWRVPDGTPAGPPMNHTGTVWTTAFSPDGARILAGTTGGMAHLWNVTGEPIGAPLPCGDWVRGVAFSPDSTRIVIHTQRGKVLLRQADTGATVVSPLPHHGMVESVRFSPDSRTLITAGANGVVIFWETQRGQRIGPTLVHRGSVGTCALSRDGRTLLTVDGRVRLWQAPAGLRRGAILRHKGIVRAVAFSPDGRYLLTGSMDPSSTPLWDTLGSAAPLRLLPHGHLLNAAAFSFDGQLALTGTMDGRACLWDVATGRPVHVLKGHEQAITAVAFSRSTALTCSEDRTARLWDIATGKPLAVLPHADAVRAAAITSDGRLVLTGTADGTANLWDLSANPPRALALKHERSVETVCLSPDGRTAFTGDFASPSVHVWDTTTGASLRKLEGHAGYIRALAVSRDGRYVASASADRTARLWNAQTGEPVGAVLAHQALVRDVTFSPDGVTVFTGSEDHTGRRWHLLTGVPIGPAFTHDDKVQIVAVHPDGTLAATGSWDKTVALWETPGPATGSSEQLTQWAQSVTGIALDETGAVRVLPTAAWQAVRQSALGAR